MGMWEKFFLDAYDQESVPFSKKPTFRRSLNLPQTWRKWSLASRNYSRLRSTEVWKIQYVVKRVDHPPPSHVGLTCIFVPSHRRLHQDDCDPACEQRPTLLHESSTVRCKSARKSERELSYSGSRIWFPVSIPD